MSYAPPSHPSKLDPSQIPSEPTGPIAADSLAAESLKNQGGFAENTSATASSVRGANSTFANTDTSGASVLHAAPSGADREQQDARGAGADERGPGGLKLDVLGEPDFDGAHKADGYYGGSKGGAGAAVSSQGGGLNTSTSTSTSTDTSTTGSSTTGSGPEAGKGVRPHVPQAPGYTANVAGAGTYKPKGTGLEDADATGSMPKTKTFTGDVGGVHDPARLAERDFENRDASSGREAVGEEGGQYGVLQSESA